MIPVRRHFACWINDRPPAPIRRKDKQFYSERSKKAARNRARARKMREGLKERGIA